MIFRNKFFENSIVMQSCFVFNSHSLNQILKFRLAGTSSSIQAIWLSQRSHWTLMSMPLKICYSSFVRLDVDIIPKTYWIEDLFCQILLGTLHTILTTFMLRRRMKVQGVWATNFVAQEIGLKMFHKKFNCAILIILIFELENIKMFTEHISVHIYLCMKFFANNEIIYMIQICIRFSNISIFNNTVLT